MYTHMQARPDWKSIAEEVNGLLSRNTNRFFRNMIELLNEVAEKEKQVEEVEVEVEAERLEAIAELDRLYAEQNTV